MYEMAKFFWESSMLIYDLLMHYDNNFHQKWFKVISDFFKVVLID